MRDEKGKIKDGTNIGNTFSKTNQPEGRGRPKKLLTEGKGLGYKESEIKEVMSFVLTLTKEERKKRLDANPDGLEAILMRAIDKSAAKGEYRLSKDIIEMVTGKAKQSVKQDIEVKEIPSKREDLIERLEEIDGLLDDDK